MKRGKVVEILSEEFKKDFAQLKQAEIKKKITVSNKIVEARYSLSALQQKLFVLMLSMIDKEDDNTKIYEIDVRRLLNELEIENPTKEYSRIKEALLGLGDTKIKIEHTNGDTKEFLVYPLMGYIAYTERVEKNISKIYLAPNPFLKPYLIAYKEHFTNYTIKYLLRLDSKYSIRLYQVLKVFKSTGYRIFDYNDFREILGVEPHEYQRFSNFQARVLEPSIKEVSELTDLNVYKVNVIRNGKRPDKIEFYFKFGNKTNEIESIQNIDVWYDIGSYRKKYKSYIDIIFSHLRVKQINHVLTDNQLLFIFINTEHLKRSPESMVKQIVNVLSNKSINNHFGYLVSFYGINANISKFYKELAISPLKYDDILFKNIEQWIYDSFAAFSKDNTSLNSQFLYVLQTYFDYKLTDEKILVCVDFILKKFIDLHPDTLRFLEFFAKEIDQNLVIYQTEDLSETEYIPESVIDNFWNKVDDTYLGDDIELYLFKAMTYFINKDMEFIIPSNFLLGTHYEDIIERVRHDYPDLMKQLQSFLNEL